MLLRQLMPAIRASIVLAIYTGIVFPFAITGIAQTLFAYQANGSLLNQGDKIIGSALLAQKFKKKGNFQARPSAAGGGYAAESSGGTNLGPTSKRLFLGDESFAGVTQLAAAYRLENNLAPADLVPVDAVTRSASGLDPHITVANAQLQVPRVAAERRLDKATVEALVKENTEGRQWGVFGEPGVNVLRLNLALDALSKK